LKPNEDEAMADRAVLSVHTKPEIRQRLEALARATNRTKSSLANEALEQYVSHQEWLISEIERGVAAADAGELVDDSEMEAWFRSIGATR
jgi:RHH-type rel operon transcriptional repressor/antitoxin RelB